MWGQFSFGHWLPESRLCLEFISLVPAVGRFLRSAVIVPCGYLSLQIFLPSLRVVVLLRLGFPLIHKCFMVNLVPSSALWFIFHYFKRWIHKEFAACTLNHVLFIFFLSNFIESVACLQSYGHFNNINSSNPWTWYAFWSNFFHQCRIIFWE